MYAVVKTGGKQYRVQEGDVLFVEKLDAEVESTVELTLESTAFLSALLHATQNTITRIRSANIFFLFIQNPHVPLKKRGSTRNAKNL